MITVFLSDGLGNQMFQYAFARSLQLHTNNKLRIAKNYFVNDKSERKYALHNLNLPSEIDAVMFPNMIVRALKFSKRLACHFKSNFSGQYYFGRKVIIGGWKDPYQYWDVPAFKYKKDVLVFGHFQNGKWFNSFSEIIKNELKVTTSPSIQNRALMNDICNCNSVCVHIRRGDYCSPKWANLNICNYKYYYNAMKYINDQVFSPVFYIFSNSHEDIQWIKNNYDFSDYNIQYVDLSNPDYEELRLMYSCKHFIISNSTFSWWGQYLSEKEDKIVCAPFPWNYDVDNPDIYLQNWKIIDTREK